LTQATWGGDQDTVNETVSIKGMEDNFPSLHHKSTVEVSNVCPWHSCSSDTGALEEDEELIIILTNVRRGFGRL
jgi:hypothetical protein